MVSKFDSLQSRIMKLEQKTIKTREPFDPEVTVVVFGVRQYQNQEAMDVAQQIVNIALGLTLMPIVGAIRVGNRDGRPGVIKIELCSKEDKIEVLRNKNKLGNSDKFQKVFIRSSQSHTERLIELNFKTLLQEIPNRGQYRVTGNGRLVNKQNNEENRKAQYGIVQEAKNRKQSQLNNSFMPETGQEGPTKINSPVMTTPDGTIYNTDAPVFVPGGAPQRHPLQFVSNPQQMRQPSPTIPGFCQQRMQMNVQNCGQRTMNQAQQGPMSQPEYPQQNLMPGNSGIVRSVRPTQRSDQLVGGVNTEVRH